MRQNSHAVPADHHLLHEPDVTAQSLSNLVGAYPIQPISRDSLQNRLDLVTQREAEFMDTDQTFFILLSMITIHCFLMVV